MQLIKYLSLKLHSFIEFCAKMLLLVGLLWGGTHLLESITSESRADTPIQDAYDDDLYVIDWNKLTVKTPGEDTLYPIELVSCVRVVGGKRISGEAFGFYERANGLLVVTQLSMCGQK